MYIFIGLIIGLLVVAAIEATLGRRDAAVVYWMGAIFFVVLTVVLYTQHYGNFA